jgi:hypothetical protein
MGVIPNKRTVPRNPIRAIAIIDEASDVRKILDHIGEASQPPVIPPARGPPLWELAAAQAGNDPEWDTAQPVPEPEYDQRVAR